jgi:hypothetical protein
VLEIREADQEHAAEPGANYPRNTDRFFGSGVTALSLPTGRTPSSDYQLKATPKLQSVLHLKVGGSQQLRIFL